MTRTAEVAARVFVDGPALRKAMDRRKIERPEELAAISGVSVGTVNNLLSGRTGGSRLVQKALAAALKVQPAELEG